MLISDGIRNERFGGDAADLDEALITCHAKIVWADVVYHSQAYTQAPKSCSYRVSFWHAAPQPRGGITTVLHYAEILSFMVVPYTSTDGEQKHEVFAWVKCFTHLQPNLVTHPELRYVTLVSSEASKTCFIPAKSIQSRVIFIRNSGFPMLRDIQPTQTRNVRAMFVTKDLDHRWDESLEDHPDDIDENG